MARDREVTPAHQHEAFMHFMSLYQEDVLFSRSSLHIPSHGDLWISPGHFIHKKALQK
jgi:hypothetical protein